MPTSAFCVNRKVDCDCQVMSWPRSLGHLLNYIRFACRMLRWVTVPWLWYAGVYALYGMAGVKIWALQAFFSICSLDLTTYVECAPLVISHSISLALGRVVHPLLYLLASLHHPTNLQS